MVFGGDLFRNEFILFVCICQWIFSFSLNVEELKPLNYEVNILQTPVKKDREHVYSSIHMSSKHGQLYQCMLPQVEEEDHSEKEVASEKSYDIIELLKPMKSGCLLKSKDWWTYEFCFGHHIKQFHIEDGQISGQVITLGLYDSDYDWNNVTNEEKFRNVKQRYHSQYYVNGTRCDLTGQPRNTEVRIFCEEDAGDYIHRVDEPGTCSYLITIHSSRLCSHSLLKPVPSKKAHSISCYPILSDENFQKYAQKLNAQKELADQRRNEWLNNQKERLQFMKSENLLKNENLKFTHKGNVDDKTKKLEGNDEAEMILSDDNLDRKGSFKENEGIPSTLFEEYKRELEKLKTFLPSEKFQKVKSSLEKYHNTILNEDDVKQLLELPGTIDSSPISRSAAVQKLAATLNDLLKKLDKTEKDIIKASKGLHKVKSEILSSTENSDENLIDQEKLRTEKGVEKSLVLKDDDLQMLIKQLARRSPGASSKLYEMDRTQKKKLEHAVKEEFEKVGLDTGG